MSSPVSVSILGKEYQVACPEEEKEALLASAQLLHKQMENIRSTGKVVGLDRIAVMAALNLAHDLINLQNADNGESDDVNHRIMLLNERVSAFLNEERQLDL